MGLQGSVLDWVADHRKHHAHTDQEGDPHSPHVGHGHGLKGLWHAHTGWLFETHGQADWKRYAKELYEDPGMRRIAACSRWASLGLVIPPVLGCSSTASALEGVLRGLVWGGLVRAFFLHHITWSINSICHFFGPRRFEVEDHSTNVAWLALPSSARPGTTTTTRSRARRARPAALRDRPSASSSRDGEVGLAWNVVRSRPSARRPRCAGRATATTRRPAARAAAPARRQTTGRPSRSRSQRARSRSARPLAAARYPYP